MTQLTLGAGEAQTIITPPRMRVWIDGRLRRDLKVRQWQWLPAPRFAQIRITPVPPDQRAPGWRFHELQNLPAIGSKLQVSSAPNLPYVSFDGVIVRHIASFQAGQENLEAVAEHQLVEDLSVTLHSIYHLCDAAAVEVSDTLVRFNYDFANLASPQVVDLPTRQGHVFDSGPQAKPWTIATTLGYLLAYAPATINLPTQDELDRLAGGIDLGVFDATGMTLAQALMEVARRGGLMIRSATDGPGLVIFKPGLHGARRSVYLQRPSQPLSPRAGTVWSGQCEFKHSPGRPGVIAIGQPKRYESTFTLNPGWDPSAQTDRWRDCVRSLSPDWTKYCDVFRKWVLNEHGWYDGAPWNLPRADLSAISADDFRLPIPRRFEPCLSTHPCGKSMGIVVEVRLEESADWQRWNGPLWISQTQGAIYLGGDALPGDFFQSAAAETVGVRLTATIPADGRLSYTQAGDPGVSPIVLALTSRAWWSKVHQSSIFAGSEGLGPPAERDDLELLVEHARQYSHNQAHALQASLKLGWIDLGFKIGDRIERIEGRAMELQTNSDSDAFVESVSHEFDQACSTELTIRG